MKVTKGGFVICVWEVVGEDTGGPVQWCANCGCVKGSDGRIETPEFCELPPQCEQLPVRSV